MCSLSAHSIPRHTVLRFVSALPDAACNVFVHPSVPGPPLTAIPATYPTHSRVSFVAEQACGTRVWYYGVVLDEPHRGGDADAPLWRPAPYAEASNALGNTPWAPFPALDDSRHHCCCCHCCNRCSDHEESEQCCWSWLPSSASTTTATLSAQVDGP